MAQNTAEAEGTDAEPPQTNHGNTKFKVLNGGTAVVVKHIQLSYRDVGEIVDYPAGTHTEVKYDRNGEKIERRVEWTHDDDGNITVEVTDQEHGNEQREVTFGLAELIEIYARMNEDDRILGPGQNQEA